jgi:hypothetical protein
MRLVRSVRLASGAALLLALIGPSSALADHCGAEATVTPTSGPQGTTFVFQTNLGAPSDLRMYQDESLVIEVPFDGDGPIRYEVTAEAGSVGTWLARAEVRGQTECAAEATFMVTGPPDTSTAIEPARPFVPATLVAMLAGIAAFGLSVRRFAGSGRWRLQ